MLASIGTFKPKPVQLSPVGVNLEHGDGGNNAAANPYDGLIRCRLVGGLVALCLFEVVAVVVVAVVIVIVLLLARPRQKGE